MFKHGWKLVSLIVLGCFVFLWLIKASVMAVYFTDKLGIPVTARTVSMWPTQTIIRHFRIANPYGFKSHTAFEVKKTTIDYRLKTLMSTPCEIDEIVLDDIYLNIDIRNPTGTDNNWSEIGAQMHRQTGGKRVIVHKLVLRNMEVEVQGKGAKVLGVNGTRHFKQMEFHDIDSAHGFPTKELISQIFQGAGIMKYLEKFLNPTKVIKDTIKDTLKPLKMFGQHTPEKSKQLHKKTPE